MKLILGPLILFFGLLESGWCQRVTGFYLTVQCEKSAKKIPEQMGNRSVCLPENPIIPTAGISAVGPISETPKRLFFEVKLTPESFSNLRTLSGKIKSAALALVIRDELFVILGEDEIKEANTYKFYGEKSQRQRIEYYHARLREDAGL